MCNNMVPMTVLFYITNILQFLNNWEHLFSSSQIISKELIHIQKLTQKPKQFFQSAAYFVPAVEAALTPIIL